jgi:hypothetical protein
MTGFFNVPSDQELRHQEMTNFMKEFLLTNLKQAIQEVEFIASTEKEREYRVRKEDIEAIALRAATEFCLILDHPEFLFNEVYSLFQEGGLEKSFVKCLAGFFKSGKLRHVVMSDGFIRRIIQYFESEQEFE